MAEFHFVEDYQKLVAHLVETMPIDEAMSVAVGGAYKEIGSVEKLIVEHFGLREGHRLIDLGCGSGRLASALSSGPNIEYLGIDVVEQLLDYARQRAPGHYEFVLNHALKIPSADGSADMISAFSVFTHLLHGETYIYLQDGHRCLKAGGCFLFSFLEFQMKDHWPIFSNTVEAQRHSTSPHLNQFIERNAISLWAEKLGYSGVDFVDSTASRWPGGPLGQSIAVLTK